MIPLDSPHAFPEGRVPPHPAFPLGGGALSVQAISWVLDYSEARLGPRHVLISIANHAKSDGSGAWPSVSTIARESKLSEREVRYALRELEKSGELRTQRGKGPHGCNLYSLAAMGQTLQGQNKTEGGQKPAKKVSDFAPEPKSIEPSLKQPKPRAQSRSARNSFDEEMEQRRKLSAMSDRLIKEHDLNVAIHAGAGPR